MTEKDYNPEQKQAKSMQKMQKAEKAPVKPKVETTKVEKKTEVPEAKETNKENENKTETKTTEKKPEVKVQKIKKEFAIVDVSNSPVSTKKSRDFCKFIRGKKLDVAIKELEEVKAMKRAIPAKGEVSHQKGKGMAGGIYATRTAEHFLVLLKSLLANSNNVGLENPVIDEAIANIGQRPYGRFGRARKKRTHLKLVAREMKTKQKSTKKTKEKKK